MDGTCPGYSPVLYFSNPSYMADWQNPETIATWIAIVLAAMALMVTAIVWLTRLYLQRMLKTQQEMANAEINHQKLLLKTSVTIQERERNRMALELHDGLLSKLSILALASHGNQPIAHYSELINNSVQTARAISHDLCPPLIEEALLDHLLINHLQPLKRDFTIRFWASMHPQYSLNTKVKLQVFRIFQEVVNNIVKHAAAHTIDVYLRLSPKCLVLQVVDDGVGFKPDIPSKGLGLHNIELRTQLLQGSFRFQPAQNQGMQFILRVPLQLPKLKRYE
ncbi:MAG TPA: hypothetical protein DCG19_07675 [Cryomorphaceae bacterium]|nr:hypothetical protein [Owenweeksia sp.]MBF98555.1 hypothetical protein [Owenweeksia sp.]MBF99792.1 hypothetical protein [Owenweeksia sp.]HAD97270.1 hypothetical protein [Cryomorphaceae bacterium]HBF20681.1 hypothetical protein [Cryomorphaceae bacterium]